MGPRRIIFFVVAIVFGALCLGANDENSSAPKEVTFNRDVAPILFKNCAMCHRPNDMAPMSLTTYKETRAWAQADSRRRCATQDAALACRSQSRRFQQ